jgi:predicted DNA-binding mobile mystery protein A
MRSNERVTARKQLDKRLGTLRHTQALVRPHRGWVRAIREALGMTTAQLGKRLGVSQPRIVALEKAEASGSTTLESLTRAANALNCQLVYALVPRTSLEEMTEGRALALANKRFERTSHTMALEAQRVDSEDEREQVLAMARRLIDKSGSELWEEE